MGLSVADYQLCPSSLPKELCTRAVCYLYQRNGIYYCRLKVHLLTDVWTSKCNSVRISSVSLRTRNRRIAMRQHHHIKSALRAIRADNPLLTYEDMRGHLRELAEAELSLGRSDIFEPDMVDIYRDQYGELGESLVDAIASEPLTVDQHRYINEAQDVLKACMARVEGSSQPLIDYIDGFNGEARQSAKQEVDSVEPRLAVTLRFLVEQYEKEKAQNWKPATLKENQASHDTLIEIFNYLGLTDLTAITRANMLEVRDVLQKIPKNRKQRFKDVSLVDLLATGEAYECMDVVTINNKYLVKMAALFKWAVRNDLLIKNLTEGLELKVPPRKVSEARKAFSVVQVGQLVDAAKKYAVKPSGKPYHYYVVMLAAITGARLNEVAQIQVKDVRTTEAGTSYIHINEDTSTLPGKSIKNPYSERCVPLVDGAYGFALADFMALVEARRRAGGEDAMVFDGLKLMKNGYGEQVSKWFNRTLLPKVVADRDGLAFHSFRHTVATQLKQQGVELAYAQAILGHSSGSITYDRYAKEVEVEILEEKLSEALSVVQ
ncbi:integrase [Escherichia coli]|nr:site-specific integrase [Escherichia coli]MDM1682144.1 site-specific integrase [Escherichia coli]RCA42140.1 integrase [Escherichia coli]RCA51430.1 integrase [Escherichia coli]HAV8917768.1 site-specific integrase [Escherichia coli]